MGAFKAHKAWIYMLTVAWLAATFEHNAFTLSKYSHGLIRWGVPFSDISALLVVLALDLSIFWSVRFIPQANEWGMSTAFVKAVLLISTLISIVLNVRYMVTASPTNGFFDLLIAIVVGSLIPTFVAIFGWIEGNVSIAQKEIDNDTVLDVVSRGTNKKKFTDDELQSVILDNPGITPTKLASMLNTTRQTVYKRMKDIKSKIDRSGGDK